MPSDEIGDAAVNEAPTSSFALSAHDDQIDVRSIRNDPVSHLAKRYPRVDDAVRSREMRRQLLEIPGCLGALWTLLIANVQQSDLLRGKDIDPPQRGFSASGTVKRKQHATECVHGLESSS
jgi:hypothetical protein